MTPKEKAEELCYKMCLELPPRNGYLYAKQCALIAVDEILEAIEWHEYETPNKEIKFWKEVKTEIEKL